MRMPYVFAILLSLIFAGCGMEERRAATGAIEVEPCHVGGCSGEICSERADVASTCMWKPQFVCYRTATCEPQGDGHCDWTQTRQLTACLEAPGPR